MSGILRVVYRDGSEVVIRGVIPLVNPPTSTHPCYHVVTTRGDNHWFPNDVQRVDLFGDEGAGLDVHPFTPTYEGGQHYDGHCNLCGMSELHPTHDRPKETEP